MAPTPITATQLGETPVTTPTPGAVDGTNGNIVNNTGRTVFRIKNSDGAATHTVTFKAPGAVDGMALPGKIVTVPISGDVEVSGYAPSIYGARLQFLASDATHLTVSVTEPGGH